MKKNYSFHLRLNDRELKENVVFWEQALNMNLLWDALLEYRNNFLNRLAPLYEDKENNAQALKEEWNGFDKLLYQVTTEPRFKDEMNWEARESVLETFKRSHQKVLKSKGDLNFKGRRIKSINFYHRISGRGWKTSRLYKRRSKKIELEPINEDLYEDNSNQNRKARISKGIFGIGKDDYPLAVSVLFHRRLPVGKIKIVRLKGEFNQISHDWKWKLIITVESDDPPETERFAPIAALDLNWRRIGDYLRIGYLKDTAGNCFEIRLPLEEKPNAKARSLLKLTNRIRLANRQPEKQLNDLFPHTLQEIIDWDIKTGNKQQSAKDEIKKLYESAATGEISAPAKHFLEYFQRIGRRGLLKLLAEFSALEQRDIFDDEVITILSKWKQDDHELRLAINRTHTKFTNKKKTLYENIALWLKNTYSYLAWEGDLKLQEMAQIAAKISLNSKDIAIKKAGKYRNFAGLSVLRKKLQDQNLNQKWLINIKAKNTTKICHLCGAECDVSGSINVQCSNGHIVDVDANSVNNMLAKCPENIYFSRQRESIAVPEHLKSYIVGITEENKM